jgi:hypothetical protein
MEPARTCSATLCYSQRGGSSRLRAHHRERNLWPRLLSARVRAEYVPGCRCFLRTQRPSRRASTRAESHSDGIWQRQAQFQPFEHALLKQSFWRGAQRVPGGFQASKKQSTAVQMQLARYPPFETLTFSSLLVSQRSRIGPAVAGLACASACSAGLPTGAARLSRVMHAPECKRAGVRT